MEEKERRLYPMKFLDNSSQTPWGRVSYKIADLGFVNGWIQGMEAADPKLALLGENMTEGYGAVANNML